MRRAFTIWLTLVALIGANGCNQQKKTRTVKLAHTLDVSHSVHQAMVKMGEDLEELSGGKLKIEIYPNQQLGTERECLELLQIGSLGMTKVSVGVLENFAPGMRVLGLPFLFRDREHAFKVLDGPIGQELLNEGEQYWLKGLGYYDAGCRSFYTKERPVNQPDDLKGLKIRVMESVTAMDMVTSLGGSPTPISWGELYTSLQQGVVDGAENNPPSFYLSRHYEVCKYYSLDEHTLLPDVLVIGTHLWNRLTPEERTWLKQAVDKSVKYQRELWAISETEALEMVQKAGVEIIRPDKKLFAGKVEGIYEGYKKDKKLYEIIREIQSTH
ncbi:TRAP transporter substrate-binding protein [Fulvivirga sp. 29W222]|uniref:TRAP transporter substrate-binding protein n=1 Tax=Fulvivirga marina TaxID=2494733 RepID=A0A937G3C0_9BACT|nr:TRAP transporter substrate-binding protein [Fulvivirga marina]MBL6449273.1 TRAP transporter substrate-binding protein [Fulvivirga marina]